MVAAPFLAALLSRLFYLVMHDGEVHLPESTGFGPWSGHHSHAISSPRMISRKLWHLEIIDALPASFQHALGFSQAFTRGKEGVVTLAL
jgi:hypothetical protein